MNYTEINSKTIDSWVKEGWEWGIPISHETFQKAKAGDWTVLLTPTKPVPKGWFPQNMKGLNILGLASGGGQQIPIFAALGAECTVLDYSKKQIESELMVASREGYKVNALRADMTKPLPFADGSFDLIFHPVSNCYVEDVLPIWRECFRVLKPCGRLLSGLDNGFSYLFDEEEENIIHSLPFNPLKNPEQMRFLQKFNSGVQFSHTLEEQIRGQLHAGFTLCDLYEDTSGSGRLHLLGVPTFWATYSEKR